MALIADCFQIFILIACLIGLGLFSRLFAREVPFVLHFCFTPVVLAGCLFFLEHFLPLGQLPWVWIPALVVSLVLILHTDKAFWKEPALWFFLFGFGVCLFWRFSFPDIYQTSENLSDHAQLVSNSTGGLLPPNDCWVKGAKDDIYYVFQFYAAGLIHRMIGCDLGLTYHLGYCMIAGFTATAIGCGVYAVSRSLVAGALAVVFLVLGGNGASIWTPFMQSMPPAPVDSMRFIGCFAMPNTVGFNHFALGLIQFLGPSKVIAPMEFYSYTLLLGDFHPPLSSIFLLGLAILGIGVSERSKAGSLTDKICVLLVISTPFFVLISNTWTVPLQGVLVAGWLIYRRFTGRPDSLGFLFLSGFFFYVMIEPFFMVFSHATPGRNKLAWVPERPPFLEWLMMMLPACVIWIGCLWAARSRPLARLVVILGLLTLSGTYFYHVDDDYGGMFEIFNTSMKWWPWVYTLLITLGFACVWSNKTVRFVGIMILSLSMAGNLYLFANYWLTGSKVHAGRFDGYAWFTDDLFQRSIYEQLLSLPKGVVIESTPPLPISAAPSLSLAQFTGNYSVAGYSRHEVLWRGGREDLIQFTDTVDQFYLGLVADPVPWLRSVVPGGITYIIWMGRDNDRGLQIWPKINEQIKAEYDWRSTFEDRDAHWGIWIKRNVKATR